MIELKSLQLKNFFSHKDSSLNFEDLTGLVLVEGINRNGLYGSNGSGKSSILEGIVYALTGNTLRNVGVSDMVNRSIGKNTSCTLSLTSGDSDIVISRYRKDDKFGDSIVLLEGGKDISSRLNKSTQATIDTKLGIPYKVLTNTILLGEGLSSRFTQLSDPEKKALIESTLSLSYDMNQLRDKANKFVKDLKLSIAELSGAISSTTSMIDSITSSESVDSQRGILVECVSSRDKLSAQVSKLSGELEAIANKITVLEKAKKEYETLYRDYTTNRSMYEDVAHKLNELFSTNRPCCSLCGQPLQSEDTFKKVQGQYQDEMSRYATILKTLEESLSKYPPYETITSKLTDFHKEYTSVKVDFDNLNISYTNMVAKVASIEASIKRDAELSTQLDVYKAKLNEDKATLDSEREDLSDYEYIYKLFSPTGLVNYILEEAISYINDRMRVYTEMLIDKAYTFGLSNGKLALTDSEGSSYQSLSNGEKRRLDICIQFSLHDYVYNYCGIKVDLLFIDEILDTLDSVGIDNIFDVLRSKMEYCNLKRVLVITHNSSLKDKFDRVITVYKDEEGFSKISGGNENV